MNETTESGLAVAIEHGFTEEQYRAAKRIEAQIFGWYQWTNQDDRAASMVVSICDALREERRRAFREAAELCWEVKDRHAVVSGQVKDMVSEIHNAIANKSRGD